jgi:hypothetical protein
MKLFETANKINPMIVNIYDIIIEVFLPNLFSEIPIKKVVIKPETIKVV